MKCGGKAEIHGLTGVKVEVRLSASNFALSAGTSTVSLSSAILLFFS